MAVANALNQAITQHAVPVGTALGSISSLAVGADHSVMMGSTGADPSFTTTGTPYVTSISFDAGTNTLDNYTNAGSWVPTLVGGSTAGTTGYSVQTGGYVRIGNLVWVTGQVTITSATGTGQVVISLPLGVRNAANLNAMGTCNVSGTGWTWPTGTTHMILGCVAGTSVAVIVCGGTGVAGGNLQMANAAGIFTFSACYWL